MSSLPRSRWHSSVIEKEILSRTGWKSIHRFISVSFLSLVCFRFLFSHKLLLFIHLPKSASERASPTDEYEKGFREQTATADAAVSRLSNHFPISFRRRLPKTTLYARTEVQCRRVVNRKKNYGFVSPRHHHHSLMQARTLRYGNSIKWKIFKASESSAGSRILFKIFSRRFPLLRTFCHSFHRKRS